MARGSFTMYAVTTDTAVTLPSHVSMLTGVSPAKHGIIFNADPKPSDAGEPAWPTLFAVAHRAGLVTAMSAGKSKFSVLAQPGTLDLEFLPPRGRAASDSVVADAAVNWLARQRPQVLFVHLPGPDLAGHAGGWGSSAQLAAAATADRALGRILEAIARSGLSDSTLIIVTADHCGAGTGHGGREVRSRLIPWIAAGPGVRRDYDLTREDSLRVRTEDTFATTCAWLDIAFEKPVDGRAVTEIFETATRER
jgi:arylsulfatase A-like enzyme